MGTAHLVTNDIELTTRYTLFDGGDGDFYQICDNLGMTVI